MSSREGGVQAAIAVQARILVEDAQSPDEALEALARMLGESAGLSRASLRMVERDELVIVAVWSRGPTALRAGARMPIRSSDFLEVLREGGPVVHEASDQEESLLDQILIDEGNRSWVLVPLHQDDATVGVLSLSSRIPRAFRWEDAPVYAAVGRAVEGPLVDLVKQSGRIAI